jgi:hypothetical protein
LEFECGVVDEVAGFEVIGAIKDELGVLGELSDVGEVEVGDDGFDEDFGVDASESVVGGDCFGEVFCGILFIEENLALEVGVFDEVAVDDADVSDAGASE